MKITFFIGSISGGGAERVVCNLSNYLVNRGHNITVLTVGKTGNAYGIDEKVNIISLEGKRRIKFSFLRAFIKMHRLKEYLKNCDADLIVGFLPKTIKALMCYKRHIKCPVVLSERCSPQSYLKRKQQKMLKCFNAADGAVFQTEEIKNFYTDRIAIKNFTVIPNAVNPDFIKPPFTGERRKTVIAVGRHSKQKNFELLIDAFAEVVNKFPDYSLEIYGKGELTESYIERCEKLGIREKVFFPGFCENMQDKIYGASLFVLSSDYEGIPNALIEAMALSTPCVSTDCIGGGARALIKDGENGILLPVNDKNALISAMEKVLSDKTFAEKIARKAAEIQYELSATVVYEKWEKYFSGIIKNEI